MSRTTAGVTAVKDGKITDEALGMLFRKAMDGARRVGGGLSLDTLLAGYQAANEGREFSTTVPATWKTIEVGTHKSLKALRKALEDAGFRISDWVGDILSKMKLEKKQTLDLVVLSVKELGFAQGARYDQICEAGLNMGLELCPAEVGPQLRLQYADQPAGEWLSIAMEAIIDSDGGLYVFYVERSGGARWLRASYGHPDRFWRGRSRFVFVRRKLS